MEPSDTWCGYDQQQVWENFKKVLDKVSLLVVNGQDIYRLPPGSEAELLVFKF